MAVLLVQMEVLEHRAVEEELEELQLWQRLAALELQP